jgi:hypothetical protein
LVHERSQRIFDACRRRGLAAVTSVDLSSVASDVEDGFMLSRIVDRIFELETGKPSRPRPVLAADQEIFHRPDHPSAIILPVA